MCRAPWRQPVSSVAVLCFLFRAPSAAAVRCPERLAELSSPNCGAEDPECPLEAPYHPVNISHDGVFRYVQTSYCPPYDWSCLQNPKGRRPCARRSTFKVPMYPRRAAGRKVLLGLGTPAAGFEEAEALRTPPAALPGPRLGDASPMLGAIGVLLNGVALNAVSTQLSDALPAGAGPQEGGDRWVDAGLAEAWMDDGCHGHLSGGGNYHVHAARWAPEQRAACGLPMDVEGRHSELLGWAFDGHGLYGPLDEGGLPVQLADLDECGGHTQQGQGGYHYHLVAGFSYNLACYHGCPELSNNFRFKGAACEPGELETQPLQPPPPATQQRNEL